MPHSHIRLLLFANVRVWVRVSSAYGCTRFTSLIMIMYVWRSGGAAHYHAYQMMIHSPSTCSDAEAYNNFTGSDCLPNANDLDRVCCFRQEDCDNCTRGPDYRIIEYVASSRMSMRALFSSLFLTCFFLVFFPFLYFFLHFLCAATSLTRIMHAASDTFGTRPSPGAARTVRALRPTPPFRTLVPLSLACTYPLQLRVRIVVQA